MPNVGNFVLDLVNAEGTPAQEPDCTVEFLRLDQVALVRANHLQFPPSHSFSLPAFPQGQNLHCMITPSRYRIVQSNFFTLTDGSTMVQSVPMMRDPAKWQPAFSLWNSLASSFGALKQTIENKLLKLKHGPDVGVVTPAVYDSMSSPALLLAKMAMLNLYAVLSAQIDPVSGQPWFNGVQQILVIDQERFVARISSDFFESVDHIAKNIHSFHAQGFFPADSSLHTDNIPSDYTLTAPLESVKCAYEQGNVQFTVAPATNSGNKCFLLDCDMDENANLFLHLTDLFKHQFTGGTNPIDIHEYIVHHQNGVDLGYELRPLGKPMMASTNA